MLDIESNKTGNFRSITFTLTVAFLSLSFLILCIVSATEIYLNWQIQQKTVADNMHFIAAEASVTVKNFIQGKFNLLETTIRLSDLVANPTQKNQILIMEKLLGSDSSFRHLVLFGTDKQELAKVSQFSTFIPVNLTDQIKNDIFLKAHTVKRYISPVYIDSVNSEPMAIIAVSIDDLLGNFKGVLIAEVNLKYMWNVVDKIKVGDKGTAYVVDRSGTLLAYNDTSRVLKGENVSTLISVNRFIRDKTTSVFSESIDKGIQGTTVVSNFVPLDMPNWAVIVELPVMEAYQVLIQELSILILAIIVCVVVTVIIGLYLSNMITRPIINLRDAVIKIGEGNLETKIDVKTKNEIGQLADSFNQMAVKLRNYYEVLEQKVNQRTVELEESKKKLEENVSELEKMNKLMTGRELKMIELKKEIDALKNTIASSHP